MLPIFFLTVTATVSAQIVPIQIIPNGILINTTNSFYSTGKYQECLCRLVTMAESIVGFNYFSRTSTCQYFSGYYSLTNVELVLYSWAAVLKQNESTTRIAVTTEATTQALTSTFTTLPQSIVTRAYWSFDENFNNAYSLYSSIPINNPTLCSSGIAGGRPALCVDFSQSQYVLANSTDTIDLSWSSFTVELWIYPYSFSNSNDRGIIGQCEDGVLNKCLLITIRGSVLRMTLYYYFCEATLSLSVYKWYHIALVYDYSQLKMLIYVDGVLACTNAQSGGPLQISRLMPLTIGYTPKFQQYYFDGRLDEISIIKRVKSSEEILADATLVAYYSFDNMPITDSGPNNIRPVLQNIIHVDKSISFTNSTAFFQAGEFILLGDTSRSYSISIWIRPLQVNGSTIIHLSSYTDGTGIGCVSLLGFDITGRIIAIPTVKSVSDFFVVGPMMIINKWIHICQTYSRTDGFRLYVNGTLISEMSGSANWSNSINSPILTLGNPLQSAQTACMTGSIQPGAFSGQMDEFRVYSRSLNYSEIQLLSQR